MKEWDKTFKILWGNIKKTFDEKGISMPTISIDTSPGPITYGIKTTDKNGNIFHSQIKNLTNIKKGK